MTTSISNIIKGIIISFITTIIFFVNIFNNFNIYKHK